MPMIDSEKLKSTLTAWQTNAAEIVKTSQAADAAFLRGDRAQADALGQQVEALVRERHTKADNVAKLVEALIWQAENDKDDLG